MSAAKFTPGPWVPVATEGGWDGVAEKANPRSLICRLALNEPGNASLIAAAPALLEFAEAFRRDIQERGLRESDLDDGQMELLTMADAAIRKATGAAS